MECLICCEPYTKKQRKPVRCLNCNHEACLKCSERFILDASTEAKCMNCNAAWGTVFLHANFSQAFIKRYRQHRVQILWGQQLYQLPIASEWLANQKIYKENELECLKKKAAITEIREELCQLKHQRSREITMKRKRLKEIKRELMNEADVLSEKRWNSEYHCRRIFRDFTNETDTRDSRRVRQRPCITQDCKGFLDSEGSCPVCAKITCLNCNTEKTDQNHQCSESDIETWNDLKKTTRPCPNCNTRIFKISGCDQMFCIQCNTAFSWTRGTIATGAIHNPHYFEWLYRQRDDANVIVPNQLDCNEDSLPCINIILRNCQTDEDRTMIGECYRKLQHFRYVTINRYRTSPVTHRSQIFNYLLKYLQNQKNVAKQFEHSIRRFETNNEIFDILNSYRRLQVHLFRSFSTSNISVEDFHVQYNDCRNYYKQVLQETAKIYKRTLNTQVIFE